MGYTQYRYYISYCIGGDDLLPGNHSQYTREEAVQRNSGTIEKTTRKARSEMKLNWKKGFFKSTYEIFSSGKLVGNMKENSWKKTAIGALNGHSVSFITHGFFSQETQIIDSTKQVVVGKITYNSLRTSAEITYRGNSYQWKNENWAHSRWSLNSMDGKVIAYRGSNSKGELESEVNDELLILTGLYVANHFWQSMIAVFIVLYIVIFASS